MEKRNLLDRIFKIKPKPKSHIPTTYKNFELVNGFVPMFKIFDEYYSRSDIYISAVSSISKHISKIRLVHKRCENGKETAISKYNKILQLRPNEFMDMATFLEKAMYQYLTYNNLFIYPVKNMFGEMQELWIINADSIELKETEDKQILAKFNFRNGKTKMVYYDELIHIYRNSNLNEFIGDKNNALKRILQIIENNYQGVEAQIATSNILQFIIESPTVLTEEKKKEKSKSFTESFLNPKSGVGVAVTDPQGKITQIQNNIAYTKAEEELKLKEKVLQYLGTNESILNSKYSEDEFQSFYESTLEPFIIKLEQNFTYGIFSAEEILVGNKIVVEVDRMQTASFNTRIKVLEQTRETGDLTTNERRRLLYLPELEDGNERQISLNFVKSTKQDEYQTNKQGGSFVNDG